MFTESDIGKIVKYKRRLPSEVNGELFSYPKLFKIVNVEENYYNGLTKKTYNLIKVRDHIYNLDAGISDLRLCSYTEDDFELVKISKKTSSKKGNEKSKKTSSKRSNETGDHIVRGQLHPGNTNKSPNDPGYDFHLNTSSGRKILSNLNDELYMD